MDAGRAVRPEVPAVPVRYHLCATLAVLPTPDGGWTKAAAIKALLSVRAGEIKKRDCLLDLEDWTNEQLNAVRGGPPHAYDAQRR